ncbi:unnamed protein product [Protopolystoma xenopodis]|uniref:Uncharacterized protein n=1 Tax=Protopolystoma xenopodis TaxID=117903 RepID=A0A3S5CJI7_9PLAT|nr:unnamed protein product [Protopolystoma xenopodis]
MARDWTIQNYGLRVRMEAKWLEPRLSGFQATILRLHLAPTYAFCHLPGLTTLLLFCSTSSWQELCNVLAAALVRHPRRNLRPCSADQRRVRRIESWTGSQALLRGEPARLDTPFSPFPPSPLLPG